MLLKAHAWHKKMMIFTLRDDWVFWGLNTSNVYVIERKALSRTHLLRSTYVLSLAATFDWCGFRFNLDWVSKIKFSVFSEQQQYVTAVCAIWRNSHRWYKKVCLQQSGRKRSHEFEIKEDPVLFTPRAQAGWEERRRLWKFFGNNSILLHCSLHPTFPLNSAWDQFIVSSSK